MFLSQKFNLTKNLIYHITFKNFSVNEKEDAPPLKFAITVCQNPSPIE